MKISDVMKKTRLTRKAIYYYEEQGLISPLKDSETNYRKYSEDDIDKLVQINSLRQLGFSIKEVQEIFTDKLNLQESIAKQVNSINKELYLLNKRKDILENLAQYDKDSIIDSLETVSQSLDNESKKVEGYMKKQLNRILPGNIGKLFAIYYSNFLNEPINTQEKEEAWLELVSLLDSLEEVYYPEEIRELVDERYGKLDINKSEENSSRIVERVLNSEKASEIISEKADGLNYGNKSKERLEILRQFMFENFTPIFEDISKHLCILSSKFKKFNEVLSAQSNSDR